LTSERQLLLKSQLVVTLSQRHLLTLSPGTRLGAYEIVSLVGSGGMGEVYRANDTRLDRTVAIKVVAGRVTVNPEFRQRFEREARHIAALNHPRICMLFDVGHQDEISFLVMEYLEGETLSRRLRRGAVPLEQALKIGIEIGEALASAHRHGIVHRDLKPANVMLTKSGAKLLDFGLALSMAPMIDSSIDATVSPTQDYRLLPEEILVGTLPYMAPEQISGGRIDDRTDIFAFGSLLYELTTGQRAFEGTDRGDLIVKILDRNPLPLSERVAVPPAFDRVVRKCLAKDPDERWQSARDLLDELKWIAAMPPSAAVATTAPAARPLRRFGLVAAGAATLVALGAAGAYFTTAAREPPVVKLALLPPDGAQFGNYAVSPDGTRVVFAAASNGTAQLWTRSFDALTAHPLAGTTDPHDPVWSPDGQSIAFFAEGKLKRIAASGGSVQTICDAPDGRGASWGDSGVIVFAPNILGALAKVPATGGKPTPLTSLDAGRQEDSHRQPFFLPDGRHFLFIARSNKRENTRVEIGSLDNPERIPVLNTESKAVYSPPGYLLFLNEGTEGSLMALPFDARRLRASGEAIPVDPQMPFDVSTFSASSTGVLAFTSVPAHRLMWFDRSGKPLPIASSADRISNIALSADGTRVAARRFFQGNYDIWVIDLARGTTSRATSNPAPDGAPVWSPDGERIAFSSERGKAGNIYVTDASGSGGEEAVLSSDQPNDPTDWSSDGRFLLFTRQDPVTLKDLWAIPLFGDRHPFPVLQTQFIEEQAHISPDGQWIAYVSNESGKWEVYLQRFPPASGGKWQVSTAGGSQPRWRRDGREIFFVDPKSTLYAVEVTLGAKVLIAQPRNLFPISLGDYAMGGRYAVTADGNRFLVNIDDNADTRAINVALNWPVALKK
jgi:Tol biopolymer transport system component